MTLKSYQYLRLTDKHLDEKMQTAVLVPHEQREVVNHIRELTYTVFEGNRSKGRRNHCPKKER